MRTHGHDPHKAKATAGAQEILRPAPLLGPDDVHFEELLPGEAISGPGKMIPSTEEFTMRAGYRVYDSTVVPPREDDKAQVRYTRDQ